MQRKKMQPPESSRIMGSIRVVYNTLYIRNRLLRLDTYIYTHDIYIYIYCTARKDIFFYTSRYVNEPLHDDCSGVEHTNTHCLPATDRPLAMRIALGQGPRKTRPAESRVVRAGRAAR